MPGAIVIVGPEVSASVPPSFRADESEDARLQSGVPLTCVEVLGQSVLERVVEGLRAAEVSTISLFAASCLRGAMDEIDQGPNIYCNWVENVWSAATQCLNSYRESGIDPVVVIRLSAYTDVDVAAVLQSHQDEDRPVTRVVCGQGPLDIWIVDVNCVAANENLATALGAEEVAHYESSAYVNRLEHPRDLRRLVVDSLTSRCRLRPHGHEIRPGVWISDTAEVHRGARIVAPAFIGRSAKIEEQSLITRCSNVESNSHVDYGTVVEDSAILSNTYVGIGLDVAHSIANGNNLINLERDVTLRISDPGVMRPNRVLRKEANRQSPAALGMVGMAVTPAEKDAR